MMCGDRSDNIGIRNMGIKKFLGIFPEVKRPITVQHVIDKSNHYSRK